MEKKELKCEFSKSELEEISFYSINFFAYCPYCEKEQLLTFSMVDEFKVKYTLPKVDINVTIKKLVENNFNSNNYFPYEVETSIQDITNLVTKPFEHTFILENGEKIDGECIFKKINENPLYLLCRHANEDTTCSIENTNEVKELNDIHSKYNFYIQPIKNNEKVTLNGTGSDGRFTIHKTIDFNTSNETTIDLCF